MFCGGFLMKNKNFFLALILLLFLVFACAPEQPEAPPLTQLVPAPDVDKEKIVEQPKGEPKLRIISPKGDELIKSSKVTVE